MDGTYWLEIIKALASVFTAAIAFFALRNWQRQDKAKREAEFLDQLLEACHTYIAEMSAPITHWQMIKIGMDGRTQIYKGVDDAQIMSATDYFVKDGNDSAKRLLDTLAEVQPSTIKLRSLTAKGQVFRFDNYTKCQNAVAMLTWQFDRLEGFAAGFGSAIASWMHPEVRKLLEAAIAVDPDEIRKSIQENNVALIVFATDTYARIYGQHQKRRPFWRGNWLTRPRSKKR